MPIEYQTRLVFREVPKDVLMTNNTVLPALWHSLENTSWALSRILNSANTTEPSGTCTGIARFTSRPPSKLTEKAEKITPAAAEMLYTEEGSFKMTNGLANLPLLSFSRKYVWRLAEQRYEPPEISIWFTKPGTEEVDYLFHKFLVQRLDQAEGVGLNEGAIEVSCYGGHLCVEDFYSSTYTFFGTKPDGRDGSGIDIETWKMQHDVTGPRKNQSIETIFRKDSSGLA